MTVDDYIFAVKACGFGIQETEYMSIGMTLDQIDTYIEMHDTKQSKNSGDTVRPMTQKEIDYYL